jgi:hypothetical protein
MFTFCFIPLIPIGNRQVYQPSMKVDAFRKCDAIFVIGIKDCNLENWSGLKLLNRIKAVLRDLLQGDRNSIGNNQGNQACMGDHRKTSDNGIGWFLLFDTLERSFAFLVCNTTYLISRMKWLSILEYFMYYFLPDDLS